jgi:carbonic anhydrase/acetyltransferase-like protein (isoleucine patch superfamily)
MIRPFQGKRPQIHPTAFIEESAQIIGDVIIGEQSSVTARSSTSVTARTPPSSKTK